LKPIQGFLKRFSKRGKRPVIRVARRYPGFRGQAAPVPVENTSKTYQKLVGMLVAGLLLAACSPQTGQPEIPDTGDRVGDAAALVAALEEAGATVEEAGRVEPAFFDVDARLIRVNGQDVQVFEFPDEASRQTASDTIDPSAALIGGTVPEWLDVPHFWASGRVIVLYVGQDQTVIDQLTRVLGPPVATGAGTAGGAQPTIAVQPEAVIAAARNAAAALGVNIDQVRIISFEQVEWPDACLGLPQTDEACAQVVTPGFRVVLEINGQQLEFHTDQTGTNIRQSQ
jgi:hypothetical protein